MKLYLSYNEDSFVEATKFLGKFQLLGLNIDDVQKFSSKEIEILEKVKNLYQKVRLFRDYTTVQLGSISQEEALIYTNYLLIEWFPHQKNQILALDKLLKFSNIPIQQEGVNFYFEEQELILENILITNHINGLILSHIGHEKGHALCFQCLNLPDLFFHGLEMFPFAIEKMMLYQLETEFDFSHLQIADRILRIHEMNQTINILTDMRKVVVQNEMDQYMLNYYRIRGFDYLKAELYSYILLDHYIQNRGETVEVMQKLLDGKISLTKFYQFFDLSLEHKQMIPLAKKDLNKVKKYHILY